MSMVPVPNAYSQLNYLIREYCEKQDEKILQNFYGALEEFKLELAPDAYEYYLQWYDETMSDLQH